MRPILTFEEELTGLKTYYDHGSFKYESITVPFNRVVNEHFSRCERGEKYGVYIVRQNSTQDVLVIGIAGAITQDGNFRLQDIPKRLKNVKQNDQPANDWFREVFQEMGPLNIEYVFVDQTPISPRFGESLLLQTYLNENGFLPRYNKSF